MMALVKVRSGLVGVLDKSSNRSFYVGLLSIALFAIALRLPMISSETGDFLFCDEGMFYNDVLRMLREETLTSTELRSGPVNTYPVLFLAQALDPFFDLTRYEVLLLGRLIFPVFLGGLAVIPAGLLGWQLSSSRLVGLIAAILMALGPGTLATSQIWYPDHYLAFFSGLTGIIMMPLVWGQRRYLFSTLLGVAFALAVATKYTAVFLLIPVLLSFLALFQHLRTKLGTKGAADFGIKSFLLFAGVFVATSAVLHLNVILTWPEFLEAQAVNASNYDGVSTAPLVGIAGYLFLGFLLLFGPIGALGVIAGTLNLAVSRQWLLLGVLVSAPLSAAIVMGLSNLFVPRNIAQFAPFIAVLIAVGLSSLRQMRFKKVFLAGALVLLPIQISLIAFPFWQNALPDSRNLATEWVRANVPEEALVGTNEFCSGPSPAEAAGRRVEIDPGMRKRLEYYVFDSYWESEISVNFRGSQGSDALLNQKYLHFYFMDDPKVWLALQGLFVDQDPFVPEGYTLEKDFSGSGPSVWVLRKD